MVCMDAIASSDERRDFEPRGRTGARVLSDSVVSACSASESIDDPKNHTHTKPETRKYQKSKTMNARKGKKENKIKLHNFNYINY